MKYKLNNKGDTIIEVLIVLAILGLAFAISTATASKGLNQSRNAEEHSQALGILSTQIELVRTAVFKKTPLPTSTQPFCMKDASTPKIFGETGQPSYGTTVPSNAHVDALENYHKDCIENDRYHISVTNNSDYYTFRVRWDGVGTLGRQQELMTYKIRPVE